MKKNEIKKKDRPLLNKTESIKRYFKQIDKNRCYSNFGTLYYQAKNKVKQFLKLKDNKEVILTSSGHSSLLACLMHIKSITKKKYFLVPTFSFYSDVTAIIQAGFDPVFIDINPELMYSDESSILKSLKTVEKKKIAGCVIISPFGKPVPINILNNIVEKFKFHLIYDAANAFLNLDKKINNANFFTVCSFHPLKTFASNESGLIICKKKYYQDLKAMINFGINDNQSKRKIVNFGFNGKFSEYDAGIFLANFKKIKLIQKKYKIINKTISNLLNKDHNQLLNKEDFKNSFISNYFVLVLKGLLKTKILKNKFSVKRIQVYYPWSPQLMHQIKIFKKIKKSSLKNSIYLMKRMICLKLSYYIKKNQLLKIINIINSQVK